MSAFLNPFDTAAPLGTDLANNIDGYILDGTKKSLDERQSMEHYSLNGGVNDDATAGGQGRHIPGKVGCFGKGTDAQKQALVAGSTPPGDGALWLDTDDGLFYRYDLVGTYGGGWVVEQFGSGTIYATGAEVEAGLVDDKAVSALTLRQAVPEYVAISGGNHATIHQNAEHIYDIDAFFGDANLITENITELHIRCELFATVGDDPVISATYPNLTAYRIAYLKCVGTTQVFTDAIVTVPVNTDVRSITITPFATIIYPYYSVIGATQRSYRE